MFAKTTFVIIALTYANAVSLRAGTTLVAPTETAKIFKDAKGHIKLAQACLGSIMANIPPTFCWKQESALGNDPQCPANHYLTAHSGKTLCQETCKGTHVTVLATCVERCPDKYVDAGATCTRMWWEGASLKSDTKTKNVYGPHSVSLYDAPCPAGQYYPIFSNVSPIRRCYTDCNNAFAMDNCGHLACSDNAASCATTIAEMSLDTLMGVAQAASLVASFGTSSAATTAIASAKKTLQGSFKKAGNKLLLQGSQKAYKVVMTQKKSLVEKAKSMILEKSQGILEKAVDAATRKIQEEAISQICSSVADNLVKAPVKESGDQISLAERALDGMLSGAYQECKAVKEGRATVNDQIACAKGAVDTLAMIDPTGLLSIAGTFMRPVCGVQPTVLQ